MNTIGSEIRNSRKASGLSQIELAQKIGVTQAAISAFETDKCQPTAMVMSRIHEALANFHHKPEEDISLDEAIEEISRLRSKLSAEKQKTKRLRARLKKLSPAKPKQSKNSLQLDIVDMISKHVEELT